MEALYHQTDNMVQDIGRQLGRLERSKGNSAFLTENEVQEKLSRVLINCERLDVLVAKEAVTRRANAKMRVEQLKYDCQQVQTALSNFQRKRYIRAQVEQEREALLNRTFTTNDNGREATSIYIDPALQHNARMSSAHSRVDELLDTGSNILSSLRDQRGTLKGVHRKVLDMANALGLSGTVMRLTERRTMQDKLILVVGMLVTCLVMFIVWRFFT